MGKLVAVAMVLVLALGVGSVWAGYPFAGWGLDCEDWEYYYNPYDSGELIYNPVTGEFLDCFTGYPVDWPDFQIDLWIEWECILHLDWLNADIHRVSNYDDIVLELPGWIETNNPAWVVVWPGSGYDLDYMKFMYDIFNNPNAGSDLAVTWNYNVGSGWIPMGDSGENKYFAVGTCHTDFWMQLVIVVPYHADDGFYKLAGEICPLPEI